MEALRDIATWLSGEIAKLGPFELISDGSAIPVFAVKLRDGLPYSVYDLSDKLRQGGWQVPAYTMPEGAENVAVLRVVVREGFSRDLADQLLASIRDAVAFFEKNPPAQATAQAPAFAH
jgi:glutamate decarboxylase